MARAPRLGSSLLSPAGASLLGLVRARLGRATRRARNQSGMTLIEILIVLVIMALMSAMVLGGSGQTSSAKLRQGAALVTGAVRAGFSKSSARAKPMRLVFDFEAHSLALEESEDVMLLAKNDSTGGAAPVTELEAAALEESKRILAGPKAPRAAFRPVDSPGFGVTTPGKGPKALPSGIQFRRVHCEHEDEPHTEGRAYLYFFPGGQTERCVIVIGAGPAQNTEDEGPEARKTLSLLISPLTGKVTIKPGALELELPDSDEAASEREAPGGSL